MARPTSFLLRRDQGRPAQSARALRRLSITGLDSDGLQLGGPGADGDGNEERFALEVFGVAGVASRPMGNAEAVVATVGGRGHQVVIAVRDPDAARAVGADKLKGGELMIYTPTTFLKITADGEVLISRKDGILERVATESHVHAGGTLTNGGGAVTGFTGGATPEPFSGRGVSPVLKTEGGP